MYLKLMSAEDAPDSDGGKGYRLIECSRVEFSREPNGPVARTWDSSGNPGDKYGLDGNAYILNNSGKTIDSFAFDRCPRGQE